MYPSPSLHVSSSRPAELRRLGGHARASRRRAARRAKRSCSLCGSVRAELDPDAFARSLALRERAYVSQALVPILVTINTLTATCALGVPSRRGLRGMVTVAEVRAAAACCPCTTHSRAAPVPPNRALPLYHPIACCPYHPRNTSPLALAASPLAEEGHARASRRRAAKRAKWPCLLLPVVRAPAPELGDLEHARLSGWRCGAARCTLLSVGPVTAVCIFRVKPHHGLARGC